MRKLHQINFIVLCLGIIFPLSFHTIKVNAGSFGAEIFCTMRDGGNAHESSWEAAYTYIKKQKGGIFKVSPKQAAAQIVETVVREREKFSYCVEYLEALHPDRKFIKKLEKEKAKNEQETREKEEKRIKLIEELRKTDPELSEETIERYSY